MLRMPRIEIELEFDMVFCFGIRLAPYAAFFSFFFSFSFLFFPLGFTFNSLHDLLKVIVL